MAMKNEILRMEHITKYFLNIKALDDVRLNLYEGEILGLTGLNWSGKSTLVKILAGDIPADRGVIYLDDAMGGCNLGNAAQRFGIYFIGRNSPLITKMTIRENICLKRENKRRVVIRDHIENNRVLQLFQLIGIDLDPNSKVEDLSMDQQHLVHLGMALARQSRIIILDDITGTYGRDANDKLMTVLRNIRNQGISIIYVNNRLDDIFHIADRIVVLKEGKNLWTLGKGEYSQEKIMNILSGYEFKLHYHKWSCDIGQEVLSVHRLHIPEMFRNVDFHLYSGEILGFAIHDEHVRKRFGETLFGLDRDADGEIVINGKPARLKNAKSEIQASVGFISEQVNRKGLFFNLDMSSNISFLLPRKVNRIFGRINSRIEKYVTDISLEQIGLPRNTMSGVDSLNDLDRLKLCIGRWMVIKPQIMIFVNPTLGLDMFAREEIYTMINEIARQGIAVILISSDIHELVELSHRIILLGKDEIIGEFNNNDLSKMETLQEKILSSLITRKS